MPVSVSSRLDTTYSENVPYTDRITGKRVEAHGRRLAQATDGADETIVRLFALLHDVERQNESTDPAHGRRAAQLVRWAQGDLFTITDRQLDLLSHACELHADGPHQR